MLSLTAWAAAALIFLLLEGGFFPFSTLQEQPGLALLVAPDFAFAFQLC